MRYGIGGDPNPWVIGGLIVFVFVCYGLVGWRNLKKRNDRDRGGSGYTPTSTPVPEAPEPDPNAVTGEELWLIGFAAPRAVARGANPFEWNPGLLFADPEWPTELARAERAQRVAATPEERVAAAVDAAWWIRVAVASGQLRVEEARERTRLVANAARRDAGDWFAFGDLLGEREGLTPPRDLYRPGYPWADPAWPAARA
ncbi:hypothetical protein GCM10010922_16710 [Microbacterium sorbitolivorans]|uniref:Uncharacterized protein n=1 Tax=Microbacterium sorbitolivorans TaxID=1867410 RepID=A0A367Y4N3_9MICO|nr:hypothetical protein [Microbacterium sorbitolivorans]RCK60002.1 hypothetical protein DTO57_07620 [Microbacterium sorbitolivorans]GGF41898.1 hypothetical protein GCM10010922_16710 [Microbacterium sorbitolivorans]